MQASITLAVLSLLTVASGPNDTAANDAYRYLDRLHDSMKISTFPKPSEGKICLWLQESPKSGRLRVLDVKEWPVSATARYFDARSTKNELERIVVISDNGRSIRFVDSSKTTLAASDGDVVAILLKETK